MIAPSSLYLVVQRLRMAPANKGALLRLLLLKMKVLFIKYNNNNNNNNSYTVAYVQRLTLLESQKPLL